MNRPDAPLAYSAVIVTFRRPESLRRVLDALGRQTFPPQLTVVADNDPEQSAQRIVAGARQGWPGSLLYSPVGRNLGPAGGWAHAAEIAGGLAGRGDWLLVLDDDDPLGSPRLVESLATAVTSRTGAIGLRGSRWDRRRARLVRCRPPEGTTARVDYLAGGGAPLYSWAAIDRLGFFEPRLFFGFEDLDLGLRLNAAGWEVRVCPLPSLQEVPDTATVRTPWREYYKTRALVWTLLRHRGRYAVLVTVARSTLLGGLRLALLDRQPDLLLARLRGTLDGLTGKLGVHRYSPVANPAKAVETS
jgi:GT2 family glycosyltransferase